MKLSAASGFFELNIKGYGRKGTGWRDRNSLLCELATSFGQRIYKQTAPLHTWEISRLINGLKLLCNRAVSHMTLTFSEPGLSVEATALSKDDYQLQIQLDQELNPESGSYPDFPCLFDVTLSRRQLQDAIRDLSHQLASYPER